MPRVQKETEILAFDLAKSRRTKRNWDRRSKPNAIIFSLAG